MLGQKICAQGIFCFSRMTVNSEKMFGMQPLGITFQDAQIPNPDSYLYLWKWRHGWALIELNMVGKAKFFCTSKLVLDGFDRHYQAFVHFPLTSAIDKSQQHQNKFSGMPELNPGWLGETRACYLCAMHWKSEVTQIF